MLLYSSNITPRLEYIVSFISSELLQEPVQITSNSGFFASQKVPKINYSDSRIGSDEYYIRPANLLFENDISAQEIIVVQNNHHKAFFWQADSDHPFDVLAASFYLLSRYEEYLPHTLDEYGRFAHTNSLAFKEGFLNQPLVNYWLIDLKKALQEKFPDIAWRQQKFKYIPTYDIDIAWKYRHKGLVRTTGALLKSILRGNWSQFHERVTVLQRKETDPYDSYEWLDALHLYCKVRPYYFFLLADRQTGVDKNINPSKKALQSLIQYQSKKGTVGIHPSWQSGDHHKLLKQEIGWLEFITDDAVKYSRQHYIRFTLPTTFRRLIAAGIEKDFSMGYGSINGFRASIASSFYWYDLENEQTTSLQLFPFCYMEANCLYEEKLSPTQAFEELMQYYRSVKEVNGLMITIWHNTAFGTDSFFKGWKEVHEVFMRDVVYWEFGSND
ncbi:polysaccharide deacetylase family protein [Pinibacter aurantiacus]|uniref:Polysaccharide deacetylase family protein n=1 Tax=Pinibacter aurantiacus TaxID=2851599 RepID=A0A9E2SAJ6_9BACT|nr:polysaccharide deacetylase family protein [Pinibacter aurantiacus]MBV4357744.1 polysaccharide deacetylase family protein [Pinibacter aurantiacus]